MRLRVGPEFHDERRRFQLRFCCEDCVHLDRERDRCAHGWPTREHRRARYADPACREVVFCKEFELL
jgi:hypothetical protein